MDSSQTSRIERKIQHLSESVFVGLCKILGTPHQVAMRRDIVDVWNLVKMHFRASYMEKCLFSGSYGEGFRLKDSDMDFMKWPTNHRVIWDLSQTQYYDINRNVPILADSSDSPPGYSLLWLPVPRASICVQSACFKKNDRFYISRSKYRDEMCSELTPDFTIHGPCSLSVIDGTEYDNAFCFSCDFWPPSAAPWIGRCHSWPKPHVVNDIVRNGCHFVATGHKLGNHEDSEWRISFSLAEQKLVHSMNHCQFLTYGLLKLFLNEVINDKVNEEDKLMCSYHMKTVVFWVIQETEMPQWCPHNLLQCFWVCFKLILKWVYEGVCPNFFIPENNMFLSKIHGDSQAILFSRLFTLYEKGLSCLLQSTSIRSYFINALYYPCITICIDQHYQISEVDFDNEIFKEIFINDPPLAHLYFYLVDLHQITKLKGFSLTKYQVVMLQNFTAVILQRIAFLLHNMHSRLSLHNINFVNAKNKVIYISSKMARHMLKLVTKFGCISDTLYLAMYYYQTCRFREALSVIEMTKVKIAQPHLIYLSKVDSERYIEVIGGRSWSTKLRHAVAEYIILNNNIVYIGELIREQQSSLQTGMSMLMIPPLILSRMLEFLSYRYVNPLCAQTALNDLFVLVHYDQEIHIPPKFRDISWQILGICQQITGDFQASLYSYQQSLRQYPSNQIQNATMKRIESFTWS